MNKDRAVVVRICVLASLLLAAAVVAFEYLPDHWRATRPSHWWAVPMLAAAYGLAERTVFHFEFRREAISFSLSEVPTAFALFFFAPGPAVIARLAGSMLVIALQWRSPAYKLFFNAALFTFELAIAYHVFRLCGRLWGSSLLTLVFAVVPATALAFVTGSVFVSVAIAVVEGGFVERLRGELRLSLWVAPLNAIMAASTVTPTLISWWLALLAVVPLMAFWAIMRGYGSMEQRFRDLDAVHGFLRRVGHSLDIDELARTAAAEAAARLRARRAAVVVFTPAGPAHRSDVGDRLPDLPDRADDPAWSSLFAGQEAQLLSDGECAALGLAGPSASGGVIAAPITDGDLLLGMVVVAGRDGAEDRFRHRDVGQLTTLADQLAPSLRKAMFHQRIEFEARHDGLTGLPNRSSFERMVDAVLAAPLQAGDERPVVLLMDLDRFKEVNDTLGHHAGDTVLVDFSRRLRSVLAPEDGLARLAGDEFAVLAIRDRVATHALATALLDAARRPFVIDGLEVVVTMSVGVAPLIGDVPDAGTLLRRADIAMYAAKHHHTGYEMYREDIDRRTPARLSMLGDLRNALELEHITVHLQPKLDLATGVVTGMEALARWSHGSRGFVPTEEFVRVAEETGLIKQLTDSMLESGMRQLHQLRMRGHHLGLAVNLSTHDLLDEQLPDRVLRRLDRHEIDPTLLTLEITESSLLIDAPRARATIERLNRQGVRLSVDDFGTGYSSLSYLRHLPVSELKIDRGFVANLLFDQQDEVIVRSIIDLGHNLGLEVVAEGVETDEVMSRLRGFGCDVAQGFGICRPVPLDQFITWLGATDHPSRRRDPLLPGHWADDHS